MRPANAGRAVHQELPASIFSRSLAGVLPSLTQPGSPSTWCEGRLRSGEMERIDKGDPGRDADVGASRGGRSLKASSDVGWRPVAAGAGFRPATGRRSTRPGVAGSRARATTQRSSGRRSDPGDRQFVARARAAPDCWPAARVARRRRVWREHAPTRPESGDREHSEAKRSWDELEGLDPRPWLRHQVRADSTLILPARQVPCPRDRSSFNGRTRVRRSRPIPHGTPMIPRKRESIRT